jgi:hypothetical protein
MSFLWGSSHTHSGQQDFTLNNIRVASPCPADWEKMTGDERVRHCSECNLNVYNLSAMTEREIQQLITANQGRRLCTRFYRRADGTVLTRNCPWTLRRMARKASRFASAVLTACMGVTLAAAKAKSPKPTCECRQVQQKESGIKLIVVDPDGALIPNAEISLESKSSKEKLSGLSAPSGEWSAGTVASGDYQLTVKSQGFRTFAGNVSVHDRKLLVLKIKLPVGELRETVEVQAAAVALMGTVGILESTHSSSLPVSAAGGGARIPMRP